MSKSRLKNYRIEEKKYSDGVQLPLSKLRKQKRNKSVQKRIEHALRTKNVDELLEFEDINT